MQQELQVVRGIKAIPGQLEKALNPQRLHIRQVRLELRSLLEYGRQLLRRQVRTNHISGLVRSSPIRIIQLQLLTTFGSTPEGIVVGGRNLLVGTHKSPITYTYPTSGYADKCSWKTTVLLNGSVYTLSFWAKSSVNGDKIRVHFIIRQILFL